MDEDNKDNKESVFKKPTVQVTVVTTQPLAQPQPEAIEEVKKLVFKRTSLSLSPSGNKKKMWKSLKQILTYERLLPWPEDAITYLSLKPPPSFRPAKKYSDISGLIAPYTDPQTKLRYHNSEEFATVRNLPSDLISGYLALRGTSNIIG